LSLSSLPRNSTSNSPIDATQKSTQLRKVESPRGSPDGQVQTRSHVEAAAHYSNSSLKNIRPAVMEVTSAFSSCSVTSAPKQRFVFPNVDHSNSVSRSTSPLPPALVVQTFPLQFQNRVLLSDSVERCFLSLPPPALVPLDVSLTVPLSLDRAALSVTPRPLIAHQFRPPGIQAAPTSNLFDRPPPPVHASSRFERPPPPVPTSHIFDRPPPATPHVPSTPTTPAILPQGVEASSFVYPYSGSPTLLSRPSSRQSSVVFASPNPTPPIPAVPPPPPAVQTHHVVGTPADIPQNSTSPASLPIWKNNVVRSGSRRSSASTWIVGYGLGQRNDHPPRRGYADDRNERRVAVVNS